MVMISPQSNKKTFLDRLTSICLRHSGLKQKNNNTEVKTKDVTQNSNYLFTYLQNYKLVSTI